MTNQKIYLTVEVYTPKPENSLPELNKEISALWQFISFSFFPSFNHEGIYAFTKQLVSIYYMSRTEAVTKKIWYVVNRKLLWYKIPN